jgi:pheromone shutdown-related protein TraB
MAETIKSTAKGKEEAKATDKETSKTPKKKVQIRLVGTSHIAKQSVQEVQYNIEHFKPDIVCVELDAMRLKALLDEDKRHNKTPFWAIFKVGVVGYIFAKIGSWGSRKLGKMVGVEPGDEMLAAVNGAREKNIKIALIDQPIEITLSRFSSKITFKEKMRFVKDLFSSIIFPKKAIEELGVDIHEMDLNKVPSAKLIKGLVKVMKQKYPNAYSVLVDERNKVMSINIMKLAQKHERILAVVGAGHLEGMKEELDRLSKLNVKN